MRRNFFCFWLSGLLILSAAVLAGSVSPLQAAKKPTAKHTRSVLIKKSAKRSAKPSPAQLLKQARQLIMQLNAAAITSTSTTSAPVISGSSPAVVIPPEPTIDLRVVVALRCYERDRLGTILFRRKGTGVLISRFGHILTSRHLIDPEWLASTTGQSANSSFDHCDVAIPESSRTPSVAEIRAINPQLSPGFFLFTSQRTFTPVGMELSQGEEKLLDFAVLKIDGPTAIAAIVSGVPKYLPDRFPFVRLSEGLPPEQTAVVTFGYPAEAGLSAGSRFSEFYLKGAIEQVSGYGRGDEQFRDAPLVAELRAESGILAGRSGSPVFYRGQVFALIFGTDPELLSKNYAVTTPVILQTLRRQGAAAELGY